MLKFNKKVEYALISMIYLSELDRDELMSTREISEKFSIPPEILGKVLQQLSQADLLESVRGAHGGYQLIQKLDEISIHEVVSAVDRPIALVDCASEDTLSCTCSQMPYCNIKNPMMILQEKLASFFDHMTLQDLKEEQSLKEKRAQYLVQGSPSNNSYEEV